MNTRPIKMIELVCVYCHNKFTIPLFNYRKRIKRCKNKDRITCSNDCRVKLLNLLRRDEFTPFRQLFFRTQNQTNKNKRKAGNLTLRDIKELWDKQRGICAYSGLTMVLPETSKVGSYEPLRASVDRIDSAKPYNKDNCHLVCIAMNYAKNSYTHEQMQEFMKLLKSSLSYYRDKT